MEHTFKIEKELKITTENIVDCVLSCEAGGFDYWGELCSDEKDYEAARQRLAEREKADMKPCYEDVLAEILESGGKLTVYDREDDKDHELTLEKLLNGWKSTRKIITRTTSTSTTEFLLTALCSMRFSAT